MTKTKIQNKDIRVEYVPINILKPAEYNPRKWDKEAENHLKESFSRFGIVDPLLVNSAENRKNIVIGGHFRLSVIKELGVKDVPVVYINIPDIEKEKELNIRLNRNTGEFSWDLLSKFDESFLADVGFSSEELDDIFAIEETPEQFDLAKELERLQIEQIEVKKGDTWQLGEHRLYCGDSTIEADILALMGDAKADMVMTDPPYRLEYLKGKSRHGESTTGFGMKRNRRYLETDSLPEEFTKLWMDNVAKIQAKDFSIIVYENWKNIREVWGEMEKHWRVKNMLVWHLPNRNQGYSARYKFFSKHDIAMLGTSEDKELNLEAEDALLQNEYETALFAISGSPQWEGYAKGKKFCPSDFIEFNAADEKSSGQAVVFGVKPIEILIPFIKVLTERGNVVLEPFGGSGSTLVSCEKLKRRCFLMEKVPTYAEIIKRRWEKLTSLKAKKIYGK
ncbi:MAG: DNA methyltransferase [bacterium]|nr:DNA methyltransferase [bacterium]